MARRADGKLSAALAALKSGLDAARIPWMCIGGIAVIAHGVRRTTTDIDVTLRAEGVDLEALVRRLARCGIRPRIPDAVRFAKRTQVLLLVHGSSGVDLDVSLAWLSFEHEALSKSRSVDFGGVLAPAARAEDLIIYKLFAARPRDFDDAEALLLMHRDEIDLERVRRVLGQLSELADDPEVALRLDRIAQAPARPPAASRKKATKAAKATKARGNAARRGRRG